MKSDTKAHHLATSHWNDPSSPHLCYEEGDFEFRELVTHKELMEAYALRYEICVELLGWIEGDPATRTEADEYDQFSYHFGCFKEGRLVAYMRMTPADNPAGTMSVDYFPYLWQKHRKWALNESADISRLIVAKPYNRDRKALLHIVRGLYRLAYGRAAITRPELKHWYFITNKAELTALRWAFGFPVRVWGKGVTPDGKTAYVGVLDLSRARRRLMWLAPLRLRYFQLSKRLEHRADHGLNGAPAVGAASNT